MPEMSNSFTLAAVSSIREIKIVMSLVILNWIFIECQGAELWETSKVTSCLVLIKHRLVISFSVYIIS